MTSNWWPGGRRALALAAVVACLLWMSVLWLGPAPLPNATPLSTSTAYQTPTYHPLGCPCERSFEPTAARAAADTSSCGEMAERRGFHQSVISFSAFGDMLGPYFKGIPINAGLAAQLYPGWTMRVYHDYNLTQPDNHDYICNVTCSFDNLDFCDVHQLPSLGDISRQLGRFWRFAVMDDLTVTRYLVRDSDSLLNQREKDAVDAWLASNLTFHVMRDHPYHGTAILAGMWGGRNRHRIIYQPIKYQLLRYNKTRDKQSDQTALRELLWPVLLKTKDVLAHDSYFCKKFPLSSPWPTQRPYGQFVGSALLRSNRTLTKECPRECRPPQHQDWLYC